MEMNESLINHLFLPYNLPCSSDDDYLLKKNHENEYKLLEYINEYFDLNKFIYTKDLFPFIDIFMTSIQRWSILQNPQTLFKSQFRCFIEELKSGDFLPLYFHNQNASILIEIDEINDNSPLISSWQVLLSPSELTSSFQNHYSYFPIEKYRLLNRSQLISDIQCELLMDFMLNPIEYSKSYKCSYEVNEIRDIPQSHYVYQWWIQQFQKIQIENTSNKFVKFHKKHRDHIRWNNCYLPFRRSGLWMTIKVIFQTILMKHFSINGKLIYKLLITHFLTFVIYTNKNLSNDLKIFSIRKILRRLNKIDSIIDLKDFNQWIYQTKDDIQRKIQEIIPKNNWQIPFQQQIKKILSKKNKTFDSSDINKHMCQKIKLFIENSKSKTNPTEISIHQNDSNEIYSIETLINKLNEQFLIYIEIWMENHFQQWFSYQLKDKKFFENFLEFYEKYQIKSMEFYQLNSNDPIGYTRFLLISLNIIKTFHEYLCNNIRFERLKYHTIHIPHLNKLFQYLILPKRDDMIKAFDLWNYFSRFNSKFYPDLLNNIDDSNAFGVYYGKHSKEINNIIEKIRIDSEKEKEKKRKEFHEEKANYLNLLNKSNEYICQCHLKSSSNQCYRCQYKRKANKIRLKIYECPLPLNQEKALAVIFELQMPIEIRIYRDILWLFINRFNLTDRNQKNIYQWLNVSPHSIKLKPFSNLPQNTKVKLISSTKSISQSHYFSPSISTSCIEDFIYENTLKVEITPSKPIDFNEESHLLTPKIDHSKYKQLEFTLENTEFNCNDIIAQSVNCSSEFQRNEFIEYGSFRCGHYLQWWNLLTILEMNSLSISEENVVILIVHSIFQYGPFNDQSLTFPWCSQSHRQLLEDDFVKEFLQRLQYHLDQCQLNWQNEFVLFLIIIITMRILKISNEKQISQLVLIIFQCRKIAQEWMEILSENLEKISSMSLNDKDKIRIKMINISISYLLTFSIDKDQIEYLLFSNENVLFYLKSIRILSNNQNTIELTHFTKYMKRYSEYISIEIQPILNEFLEETSYKSLNEFIKINWTNFQEQDLKWIKRNEDMFNGWYDCQYKSRYLSINTINGIILIDDMTLDYLPNIITSNQLFQHVFQQYHFQVEPTQLPLTYRTKFKNYHQKNLQYKFSYNDEKKLLKIFEKNCETKEILQLIPLDCFQDEFPDEFVNNYSHWLNEKEGKIYFRPIDFENSNFSNEISFILSLDEGYLINKTNDQILVNQTSKFFENLFIKYFIRLDEKSFVYIMQNDTFDNEYIYYIYLSRLKLHFKYDDHKKLIQSYQYPNMFIDQNQWLGTLTGLNSTLILSTIREENQILNNYPFKKVIIPFGQIQTRKTNYIDHQTVIIDRSNLSKSFSEKYFVYIIHERLKILQSTDTPTGFLYLSLLHAMTSNCLPDEFLGMTGMERSFQILNSSSCYSAQPYDSLSLNILNQIALISPQVNYYPTYLTCMENIQWNINHLSYSLQHFGYYLLVKELFLTSQQFTYLYPHIISNEIPLIFQNKISNEKLLVKLYFDYRHSYNPLTRLNIEIKNEKFIRDKEYKLFSKDFSFRKNSSSSINLCNDLYKQGNVNLKDFSEQDCLLPLSQWLTNENQLKNIWIGLLKLIIDSKIQRNLIKLDRIEKLIEFLYYISDQIEINRFYLEILETILKMSINLWKTISFPLFQQYFMIEEISYEKERIELIKSYSKGKKEEIFNEIEDCWLNKRNYENKNHFTTIDETNEINKLFQIWKDNYQLRIFLDLIQLFISSIEIDYFRSFIFYSPQIFLIQSIRKSYQMKIRLSQRLINENLLKKAEEKFHHFYSGFFSKSKQILLLNNENNDIFPFENFQENSLNEIEIYFQNQLKQSQLKLQSEKEISCLNPTKEEILEYFYSLQNETKQMWNELNKSIEDSNKELFDIGLFSRIIPTNLLSYFEKSREELCLIDEQIILLGGILVNWILEQQFERILFYLINQNMDEYEKELLNISHSNWIPSENVLWLILELEMNITIRQIQIQMINHIKQSIELNKINKNIRTLIIQMNMGEGKTSVLLPMLILFLSTSNLTLIRILILKSLFPTNYQLLKYKFCSLINRKIFPFTYSRSMNINSKEIHEIYNRFKQALSNCDIILTTPEDILSFHLLTIDKCVENQFDNAQSMLIIERWMKTFICDILDECDEILHVKYQLIYTIGNQQDIDGGEQRWFIIQIILSLVKKYIQDVKNEFNEEVYYKLSERKSSFPHIRFQTLKSFLSLSDKIVNDWINTKNYNDIEKQEIYFFIFNKESSIENLIHQYSSNDIQFFLIFRAFISSEILFFALKKRYRVNYGIHTNSSLNRLMAVPFRAKDVPTDKTEFAHPDLAILLTQFSYYYSGLTIQQFLQCLNHLNEKSNESSIIFHQWINYEDDQSISNDIKIYFNDYQTRIYVLYPILRFNMLVINYYLNHFVYPQEMKQYSNKIIASSWDLSSSIRSHMTIGFSGTSDTQLLLPIYVQQYNLSQLDKTDAIVLNNLFQCQNENYHTLSINANSDDILQEIVNSKQMINVILDVGALFLDGNNRDIALKWLNLSDKNKICYVVYFESDLIYVCNRSNQEQLFVTSSASERFDECLFYLDEIHTRGSDFKFPKGFHAAVTLGNDLTKDRFVQACMRMRKLGNGHSLTFWSSFEVHQQIQKNEQIHLIDILRWLYKNTIESTWDNLYHWIIQSLSFQKKIQGFRQIQWNNCEQIFTGMIIKQIARKCSQTELIDLKNMYGKKRIFETLEEIYLKYSEEIKEDLSNDIHEFVLNRLKNYCGKKKRLRQVLNEEYQREIQQEIQEEKQLKYLTNFKSFQPILHEKILQLFHSDIQLDLSQYPSVFQRLSFAFNQTTFQFNHWKNNLWISTEFQRTIYSKQDNLDLFLRPPRWIIVYRKEYLIFISPFEANHFINYINSCSQTTRSMTTLRLFLPRIREHQSIFINTSSLIIPSINNAFHFNILLEDLIELFLFNGNLFFQNSNEQTAFCRYLGLCPKPRSTIEEKFYAKGHIDIEGFVIDRMQRRHLQLSQCPFRSNPLSFIRKFIENRNNSNVPLTSHVGSIIYNSMKLIQ